MDMGKGSELMLRNELDERADIELMIELGGIELMVEPGGIELMVEVDSMEELNPSKRNSSEYGIFDILDILGILMENSLKLEKVEAIEREEESDSWLESVICEDGRESVSVEAQVDPTYTPATRNRQQRASGMYRNGQ